MKWLLFLSLGWLSACGQTKSTSDHNVPEIFNSKYVRLVNDTNRMMLIENVVIRYGDLYVEADSALVDKPKQTVMVYGIKKAFFKEETIAIDAHKDIIRYTKGEGKFYTE